MNQKKKRKKYERKNENPWFVHVFPNQKIEEIPQKPFKPNEPFVTQAPTGLIAAHLALRDAMLTAETLLRDTNREAANGKNTKIKKKIGSCLFWNYKYIYIYI